jgi:hypothetical protein
MEGKEEYICTQLKHIWGGPRTIIYTWRTLENMQPHIQIAIPSSGCQIEWHLTIRMHGYTPKFSPGGHSFVEVQQSPRKRTCCCSNQEKGLITPEVVEVEWAGGRAGRGKIGGGRNSLPRLLFFLNGCSETSLLFHISSTSREVDRRHHGSLQHRSVSPIGYGDSSATSLELLFGSSPSLQPVQTPRASGPFCFLETTS